MLRFLLLADDDAHAAERFDDAAGAAAGARREPLHRDRLADRGLGDDERVDVEIVVVLGIGDRRGEHLPDVPRHRLGREAEDVERIAGLLAADQARDEIELLGRAADLGTDRQRLIVGDSAGSFLLAHYLLPFLSDAWPGKKRVGANSPSVIPPLSSVTEHGTNLAPVKACEVRPTSW